MLIKVCNIQTNVMHSKGMSNMHVKVVKCYNEVNAW